MKYADMAKLVYALSSDGSGYKPCGFKSHYLHHNRGIRTPRERNRVFGFFFFCAVFVCTAVPVGVIGKNQIQKQFVFLPAFQVEILMKKNI